MHNVILTTKQIQQIEVELKYARNICAGNNWSTEGPDEALAMIYAARAQEPVAVVDFDTQSWRNLVDALTKLPDGTKLYAEHDNKTEEKPLLVQAWEKRFAEQAEQEPVAKVVLNRANQITMQKPNGDYFDISKHVGEYFYTAPVRTKDLTDDEIMDLVRDECVDMRWPSTPLFIARAVITKFKEKNK